MVVEVKARGHRHSRGYVEDAQRRDRPPGPSRTYNLGFSWALPVLGNLADIGSIPHERLVVAIGENEIRRQVFLRMVSHKENFATVATGVDVGAGTVAAAGVVVNPGSTIGANCILNTGCTIDHHSHLAGHVHVGPGAHLGGDVSVGEGSLVGIGATVRPGCSIGSWAVVGAGAVVVKDLPDRVVAVGVPAKITR